MASITQVIRGDHENLFSVDKDNCEITFSSLTDGVGVAVTDYYGNLLIAHNNNDGATFRAKFTHNYKIIAEALKKLSKKNIVVCASIIITVGNEYLHGGIRKWTK